jgi:hypothetical protein
VKNNALGALEPRPRHGAGNILTLAAANVELQSPQFSDHPGHPDGAVHHPR